MAYGKLKRTYYNMRQRCVNPSASKYINYGGRGIQCKIKFGELSELWERDKADKLTHPSIDRIDNDGDYTKENCRFIEMSENRKNRAKPPICKICGEPKQKKYAIRLCEHHLKVYGCKNEFTKVLFEYGLLPDEYRQLCKKCGLLRNCLPSTKIQRLCLWHLREKNNIRMKKFYALLRKARD